MDNPDILFLFLLVFVPAFENPTAAATCSSWPPLAAITGIENGSIVITLEDEDQARPADPTHFVTTRTIIVPIAPATMVGLVLVTMLAFVVWSASTIRRRRRDGTNKHHLERD